MRKWLVKRHSNKTKDFYVKSAKELKAQYEAETTFFNFDQDLSGTLDLNELHESFMIQGIFIEKKGLIDLFSELDKDKSGVIDL